MQLRLENDVGTFDDCCIELENVENSCLVAVAFSLIAVIFSAGIFVHKWGGVYNAFKVRVPESTAGASERASLLSPVSRQHVSSVRTQNKPWGGWGKWANLVAKQWANVAFIIAVGASIDESEADDGWSWGKGACPDNSEMKREMRAVNANLKAARWDLIYGCASQVSLRARVEFMDHPLPTGHPYHHLDRSVIGEIVLIEMTELYEEFQATRRRNAATAPEGS